MECRITFTENGHVRRSRAGFTLVEMMMAAGIGSVVLTALALLIYYTSNSLAAMINYVDLDQYSRNALDRMSMEIRQSDSLTSCTTNQLVLSYNGGTLTYAYDAPSKTLTRNYGTDSTVLLRQCNNLTFAIYQRNPVGGSYDVFPAASAATAKLVQLTWTCSRSILGQSVNTESVQSAKVVLRKE